MSILDRRHQLTLLGVGLTITPRALATPQSQDIAQRLLQALSGLHEVGQAGMFEDGPESFLIPLTIPEFAGCGSPRCQS